MFEKEKQQLRQRLAEIEQLEQAEEQKRREACLANIDFLLSLTSHQTSHCSDEARNPSRRRCDRCDLLTFRAEAYWPEDCWPQFSLVWPER